MLERTRSFYRRHPHWVRIGLVVLLVAAFFTVRALRRKRVCNPDSPYAAGIVYGPQIALPSSTGIVIGYKTEAACRGAVELTGPDGVTRVIESASEARRHEITVDGLAAGTAYTYRIRVGDAFLQEPHPFRTPSDDADAPLRFVVMGDHGSGCPPQFRVARQIERAAPDLVLSTGDVVYLYGTADEIRLRYFYPYASLVDRIPFYVALGNHDVETDNGKPLLDALILPTNDVDGSERFYSFDRGGCHFAIADITQSIAEGSDQLNWLKKDLARSQARWKFVVIHFPLYSTSRGGMNPLLTGLLSPIFEATGVDMVFSGNDHTYMRSHPILDGVVQNADDADPRAVTYVISGGGGGTRVDPVGEGPFVAACKAVHHMIVIEIDGGTLTYRAVDDTGETIDELKIRK